MSQSVSAGFPSPADDYLEKKIDLNHYLLPRPASTFLLRVAGESMHNAGIFPGDVVIVDKSLKARHGDVIVGVLEGEFTLKRLLKSNNKTVLAPENQNYPQITVTPDQEFEIWGVVTCVLHDPNYKRQPIFNIF